MLQAAYVLQAVDWAWSEDGQMLKPDAELSKVRKKKELFQKGALVEYKCLRIDMIFLFRFLAFSNCVLFCSRLFWSFLYCCEKQAGSKYGLVYQYQSVLASLTGPGIKHSSSCLQPGSVRAVSTQGYWWYHSVLPESLLLERVEGKDQNRREQNIPFLAQAPS